MSGLVFFGIVESGLPVSPSRALNGSPRIAFVSAGPARFPSRFRSVKIGAL